MELLIAERKPAAAFAAKALASALETARADVDAKGLATATVRRASATDDAAASKAVAAAEKSENRSCALARGPSGAIFKRRILSDAANVSAGTR